MKASLQGKNVPLTALKDFPRFLRFNEVRLLYLDDCQFPKIPTIPLDVKCRLFADQLKTLKKALNYANHIYLDVDINSGNTFHFSDHSELIEYLSDEILPICDSARSYEFDVVFEGDSGDENSASDFIDEILQTEGVKRCSNVKFCCQISPPTHLPIECISNWLQVPYLCGNMRKERILDIGIGRELQNARQLCDHLKEVLIFEIKIFF